MNVKNLVLGVGIFIVFMFLLHNGIRAFYPYPDYKDFCNNSIIDYPYKMFPTNCTYTPILQQQEQNCYQNEGQPVYQYDNNGCNIAVKECDYCQKYFNDATNAHNKTVFIIAIIIGMIALILGFAILYVEPVGSSLMASGIGAIVYGTIINWVNLGYMGRFILLLVSLVLLIVIAWKLNTKSKWWKFW